jgi:cytochrome c biogenesis protein CcmG/thiol:disulfide interchange protein DsbE
VDRLSALTLLFALACDGGDDPPAPARSRVEAVRPRAQRAPDLESFCDVRPRGEPGTAFVAPPLAEGTLPSGGPRWINVWATWCVPCVEEIPLLVGFQERLAHDGVRAALSLVSADEDGASVTRFRSAHAGTPAGARIKSPDDLAPFIRSIGLDEGATLPIHVFLDARGTIECVRTGAIGRDDYDAVRALLGA